MTDPSLAASAAPLVVEAAVKTFRQGQSSIRALAGADLRVERSELLAIMGASGSGKSTLLHAMAGLTSLDAGRVLVEGQDLGGLDDAALTRFRRRRIGVVFQAFNLLPTLTAEDNVRLPALEEEGLEGKVEASFARLGLSERRRHKPDALSSGEQQRVAVARALITDPAIVLADEPTGSLDSQASRELCVLLRGLADEGRTIVVVTHEAGVAAYADRVVVIEDGAPVSEFAPAGDRDPQAVATAYQSALRLEGVTS